MGISKVNKKSSSNNPFKARCKRQVLFNTRGDDGGILSPKLAKEKLTVRRALLKYQFDSGNISADIQLQSVTLSCNKSVRERRKLKSAFLFMRWRTLCHHLKTKIDSIINNTSTTVISHTTETHFCSITNNYYSHCC